ncbi:DNA polymerase III subunit gamma/tau [Helicobacter trogontum]|uniref:DNA polymerase III subunit gamma/tau n=1 Tax=Helicobacter trogontum TaxID=50960 RepID=UPI002A908814|nr:DNA polymerase III subunit gamma/tau [Helicobacter trogontum]MDY5184927.1 DNA polymerase III subunit gamma/tau [Helicobacter trogontum]
MGNANIDNENMPPWDTNKVSQNPIDHKFTFTQPLDIFSMAQSDVQLKDTHASQTTQQLYQTTQTPLNHMQDITPTPQNIQDTHNKILQHKDDDQTQNKNMEAIALALKYRPKTFAELVGQESVARTLCLALDSKKIANAYLFSGLRGSGKTSSARILARSLQCENGITSSPCGICANCIAALKGAHMDITELDGASNRKIDDMRDLIEQTKYKPTMGRFKIFIIDEVHMLTKEAFNSLLKTLEEPPSYVKFILATTDPLKVPATILSRAQHFRFKRIPTIALKNHLAHILQKENVSTDEASLDMLIRNGHGSLRDTLTLLDQAIVFCQNSLTAQKLADMLGALDPSAFDSLFQALLRKDMQECVRFAKSLEGYEIEMILDELSLYIKNKMLEEIPQIPPVLGMRYANIINDSKAMLQLDCDSDFCLLLTILKMLEAQKIREVANAIKQLESMQTHLQTEQITQLSNEYNATTQNQMQDCNTNNVSATQTHIIQHPSKTETHTISTNATETNMTETHQAAQATIDNSLQSLPSEMIEENTIKESIAQDHELQVQTKIDADYSDHANINQDSNTHVISQNNTNNISPVKESNLQTNMQSIQHEDTLMTSSPQQAQINEKPFSLTKNNHLFLMLIEKLYERDYNIGDIFEKKIAFDKLEGNVLYLIFYTTEDETLVLRQAYSGIMQVMKEVYGDSIKMQVEKQTPQDLEKLMQDNLTSAIKHTEQSQNLHASTENTNTETSNTQIQEQAAKDPAMQFIAQHTDVLKSMQNELGIKDMKVISLKNL